MSNIPDGNDTKFGGFSGYAAKRITIGILLSVVALWILGILLGFFKKPDGLENARHQQERMQLNAQPHAPLDPEAPLRDSPGSQNGAFHELELARSEEAGHAKAQDNGLDMNENAGLSHGTPHGKNTAAPPPVTAQKADEPKKAKGTPPPPKHGAKDVAPQTTPSAHGETQPLEHITVIPKGVRFVEAAIYPLEYELTKRWWGWRPNDVLNFSDNVNNYQLGVLEVTRRTVVALAERLSRTGTTASFDGNLENAMNWFMVKARQYWFPSPEGRYKDGIEELRDYIANLKSGNANFFTRPDNLIPLLMSYEDLLGSCDENLVKAKEADGSDVSFFQSDDYFYYAQGVASTMAVILEAIQDDFVITLESRHGAEVLHHAIESCHRARDIAPLIITEAGLDGILANHRANIAAPISHARFYLGVLITTLST